MQETNLKRRNRVFKSLHNLLTLCASAPSEFSIFSKVSLPGVVVFIGGFIFGRWVTNADPAMLRILAQSERFRTRYDAAKQEPPLVEVR